MPFMVREAGTWLPIDVAEPSPADLVVTPFGIVGLNAAGTPTLYAPPNGQIVIPTGVASGAAAGTPVLTAPAPRIIIPTGIASLATAGTPLLSIPAFTHGIQVNATNTGLLVPTTKTLAGAEYASSADMTAAKGVISGNGSQANPWTIDRVRFTSDVVVGAGSSTDIVNKYVKFTNCRFEGVPSNPTVGGSACLSAIRSFLPAQIEITDSTSGPAAGPGSVGGTDKGFVSYAPLVVRRCNMFGACILYYIETERTEGTSILEDSYLHDIWSSAGDHTDLVNGNFHASNVIVRRNHLDGIRTGNTYVTNAFGIYDDPATSAGIIQNWTIQSNYVRRAATHILSTTSTSRFLGPYVIEDNIFTDEFGPVAAQFSTRTPTSQSNNRDQDGNPIIFS